MNLPSDFLLPQPSDTICFSSNEFLGEEFTVENFISQCKSRGASLEQLRDDLDIYFRLLKNSLIDMINTDYSDYIQVSQSMVGLDSHIVQIKGGVQQVQEKVNNIKSKISHHLEDINEKLERHHDLLEKRKNLQTLVQITELIKNFELGDKFCEGLFSRLEKASIDISTLEHLLRTVHPNVKSKFEWKVSHLRDLLSSQLDSTFLESLSGNEKDSIRKCLVIYTSLGMQTQCEGIFREQVVYNYMCEIVTQEKLEELGLEELYKAILEFVPTHATLLLRLTSEKSSGYDPNLLKMGVGFDSPFIHGYNFLARSVWPVIADLFTTNLADLFLVTDITTFHYNYAQTLKFIESFEELCETKRRTLELRSHDSFVDFLERWDLTVYYQLCFKEIAGCLEQVFDKPSGSKLQESTQSDKFKLRLFSTLWGCLHRCWDDNTLLLTLSHRHWKLTLQLLARIISWSRSPGQIPDLSVDSLALLLHNFDLIIKEFPTFCYSVIKPKLSLLPRFDIDMLQDGIKWSQQQFSEVAPLLLEYIIAQVTQQCILPLDQAHSIPRLYRKTNKEQPSKSSSYVTNAIQPILNFTQTYNSLLQPERTQTVIDGAVKQFCARFLVIISEVLTAVKRTEDSLLRIKQRIGSLVPQQSLSGPSGMSDDNKIRLQLVLDIEELLKRLNELISLDSIQECQALFECAATTKEEISSVS